MDEGDLRLRRLTYRVFADLGRAPTVAETAAAAGTSEADVAGGWKRLHDEHAIVLDAATAEIRMANPFSAVPTAFRVLAAGRWWYANCAWDAFGICAALTSTAASRRPAPTAATSFTSASSTTLPTTPACSFIASCPRSPGGTTSSSPEARSTSSGRKTTSRAGSTAGRRARRSPSAR